jgi:hypothetical protein
LFKPILFGNSKETGGKVGDSRSKAAVREKSTVGRKVSRLRRPEKPALRQALADASAPGSEADPGTPAPPGWTAPVQVPAEAERGGNSEPGSTAAEAAVSDLGLAEAAEEAARIIGSLLYQAPDSLSGGGPAADSALASGFFAESLEGANASAEMNNAAVLEALRGVLDGLPRSALEAALFKAAGARGLPDFAGETGPLASLLEALGTEVQGRLETGAEHPALLLAELELAGEGYEPIPPSREDPGNLSPPEAGLAAPESEGERKIIPDSTEPPADSKFEVESDKEEKTIEDKKAEPLFDESVSESETEDRPLARNELELELQKQNDEIPSARMGESNPNASRAGAIPGDGYGETARPEESPSASRLLSRLENIERLAEAVKAASRGGGKSLTLELSPPELGKVMLRVESRRGLVSVFLRVEKPETLDLLAEGLRGLRDNLKDQGIELGELDLRRHSERQNQAAGDGGHGRRERPGAGNGREDRPDGLSFPSGRAGESSALPEAPPSAAGSGKLNLIV